ncbi:hypothetical protein DERF_016067 [Dermatophagoides farinae]|uniref:DUF19 domain-containing protein n=3 Tax=Dermatophagoides farinae TaxID=6954 RepID=A0A922HN94_DERFA|nr:uncharacterized protein LOC124498083 isoform X2 [Dermatophagoides farinae]KAH9491339.1 hypothetical protein DERF_016067 [Dermatophagoides farinae]
MINKSLFWIINLLLLSLLITLIAMNSVYAESRYLLKNRTNCTENNLKQIELKVAKMMPIGTFARKLPENFNQAKGFCKESIRLVRETEQFFLHCYKKEMVDLAKIIIYTLKQNIKLYCRKNTKRLAKLLTVAPCVNKHINRADHCIGNFMNQTKQLVGFKNDKDKIKYACCNYVEGMKCARVVLDDVVCSEENNDELIMDSIRGLTGNFVNFVCGDFDETTTLCDQLGPQPPLDKPITKQYYTPIFLLVDLMESMKSFQSL